MKRRQFIGAAGLGALGAATGARAQAAPQIKWRLTSSFQKSLDLIYGGAETFARSVTQATGGAFQIDVFPSGEITPGLRALDAVQAGEVECAHTSLDYFWNRDPSFALAAAVPFGMNARQQNAWLATGGGERLNAILKPSNVIAFPAGNTGCQMGGWFRGEVKSVADLTGLKIRIGGFAGKVWQRLGAAPQAIARDEIRPALESGALDAAVWIAPRDDEKLDLKGPAPNYYYPGFWAGGAAFHLIVNLDKWNALPDAYKAVVIASAALANGDMLARYDAGNPPALKRLALSGATLRPFPQDVLEAAYKTTGDLMADLSDGDAAFKVLADDFNAFRRDEYLWWQVGEYPFDNFMIRQRGRG